MVLSIVYCKKGDGIFPAPYEPQVKAVYCPNHMAPSRSFAEETIDAIIKEVGEIRFGKSWEYSCEQLLADFENYHKYAEAHRAAEEMLWFYERCATTTLVGFHRMMQDYFPGIDAVVRRYAFDCVYDEDCKICSMERFVEFMYDLREVYTNKLFIRAARRCWRCSV